MSAKIRIGSNWYVLIISNSAHDTSSILLPVYYLPIFLWGHPSAVLGYRTPWLAGGHSPRGAAVDQKRYGSDGAMRKYAQIMSNLGLKPETRTFEWHSNFKAALWMSLLEAEQMPCMSWLYEAKTGMQFPPSQFLTRRAER